MDQNPKDNRAFHHKIEKMDGLYSSIKYPDAVDLWAAYFAETKDEIEYSNWRHLNLERQSLENQIWERIVSRGNSILDIGCGRGFFLKRLYENFGNSITYYGLDISKNAVTHAQDFFPLPKYIVAAGECLPFQDNSFHYIQIISTLQHVLIPSKIISEAYRLLKPGGYLYIVVHKRSLDPLIISTFYISIIRFIRNLLKGEPHSDYYLSLDKTRKEIFKSLEQHNFKLIKQKALVADINVRFYRKLFLPMVFLMKIAKLANSLPGDIFKNLEYRVYQKTNNPHPKECI